MARSGARGATSWGFPLIVAAVVVWLGLGIQMLLSDPCPPRDFEAIEVEGAPLVAEVYALWQEAGAPPEDLDALSTTSAGEYAQYWRWDARADPPSFLLWVGDYDQCDWESGFGAYAYWVPDVEASASARTAAQALVTELRFLERELGRLPESIEEIPDWSAHQSRWSYRPAGTFNLGERFVEEDAAILVYLGDGGTGPGDAPFLIVTPARWWADT